MVGRQTTAFVLSCDTAERSPLISCLYFLQSSETAHPMLAPLRRVWYMRTDSSDPCLERQSSFGNCDHDPTIMGEVAQAAGQHRSLSAPEVLKDACTLPRGRRTFPYWDDWYQHSMLRTMVMQNSQGKSNLPSISTCSTRGSIRSFTHLGNVRSANC